MKMLIGRPVVVAMVHLILLALGAHTLLNTPVELAPGGSFPRLDIEAEWPGVSPEGVQALVTAPLEEAAASVRGARRVSSRSLTGRTSIIVEIDPRADMGFVETSLREAAGRVSQALPPGVRPAVRPYVPEGFRSRPLLRTTISGDRAPSDLRALVKDLLEQGIGSVRGVSSIEVAGGAEPEVRVLLDDRRLDALGIRPIEIEAILGAALVPKPSGGIRRAGRELSLKLAGTGEGISALGGLAIGRAGTVPIRLRDVAGIVRTFGEASSLVRVNGRPTIMLTVTKEPGSGALRVAREVRRRLAEAREALPAGLIFRTVDDESAVIERDLGHLCLLTAIIAALVLATMSAVFRRPGPPLLILSSAAVSVLATFILLAMLRLTLNMLILGALTLGFGMFVGNGIVVYENAQRLRERGLAPEAAALRGAGEIFVPALASTLTTIGVFACFPFFQGRLRSFYMPLALVMISALACSMAVAFTLIPALAPPLLRAVKPATHRASGRNRVPIALRQVLHHPVATVVAAGVLLALGYRWFRANVPVGDFLSWRPREELVVGLATVHGSGTGTLDALVRRFEDVVLSTGQDMEMIADIREESASLTVSCPRRVEGTALIRALEDRMVRLATDIAGVAVSVHGTGDRSYDSSLDVRTDQGPGITFLGYDLTRLREITDAIAARLIRNPRIRNVRAVSSRSGWAGREAVEVVLRPDRESLRRYGVDPAEVRARVLSLVGGRLGPPVRSVLGGRETDIVLSVPASDRTDLRVLREAVLRTASGAALRLGDVMKLEERPVAGCIEREDRRFIRRVSWDFRGPVRAAEGFTRAVFAGLDLPPGFSADLDDGGRMMTAQEKGQVIRAMAGALAVLFMLLAAVSESFLQPLIVLAAVPLALVGVFAAFAVTGARFDSAAHIGALLMSGLVVNNAILLVDHLNALLREGGDPVGAIVRGTRERLRPILLTAATGVLGTLPMLLFPPQSGVGDIWYSLALCTAGGLMSSTPLILVVIPALVLIVRGARQPLAPEALRAFEERREG